VLDLGQGRYVRSNCVDVRLVLAKRQDKQRHQFTAFGNKAASKKSKKNARREGEPWLLATSPALSHLQAEGIVALYRQRMSIEQSFRDTKNLRVGMGLEVSRSRSAQRFNVLLLIVHLAAFVQRLIGESAKGSQLELQFSATRRKDRPEISVLTLARRILDGPPRYLKQLLPTLAIAPLRQQAINAYDIAL
jgi:transposase